MHKTKISKLLDFYNRVKNDSRINLNKKEFTVVGFKEATTEQGPLNKLVLKDSKNKEYLMEFQFYGEGKVILWQEIPNIFNIKKNINYKKKVFTLIDKGKSIIKNTGGKGRRYKDDIINWWDYISEDKKSMLSLGLRQKEDKWENLYGYRIDEELVN